MCITGYKSWRNPDLGSWFMRDFVNVVGYNAHKEHLADMLTQVGPPDFNAAFTRSEGETESDSFICSVPLINMNSTLNFHRTYQKIIELLRGLGVHTVLPNKGSFTTARKQHHRPQMGS